MGADDPAPAGRQHAAADHDGAVVQARDIRGDVHIVRDHGKRALGWLSPHIEADALAAMPHEEAAKLLAQESAAVSAKVVAALLSAHHALAVSLLGSIERARTEELIRAVGAAASGLQQLPAAADAIAECAAGHGRLGDRVGWLRRAAPSARKTQGYYQEYRDGAVHWSERGGAHATTRAAWQWYASAKGSGGLLGFPLSPEMAAAPSQPSGTTGTWQRFEGPADFSAELCERLRLQCGATLYCPEGRDPYVTWGPIGEYYERANGTWGWLGFPVSDPVQAQGPERRPAGARTSGGYQRFEGGTVFCTERAGAIGVPAAVAEYYLSRGEMGGRLGFPVSEEGDAIASPYGTTGRYQRFEWAEDYPADILSRWEGHRCPGGATVYRTEAYGIHAVSGGIGKVHERLGGTSSWLGFPTAEAVSAASATISGGRAQTFEGGTVFWNPTHRAVAVRADIVAKFTDYYTLLASAGFPVARESALVEEPDTRVQWFEHRIITVRNGTTHAWERARIDRFIL